MYPIDTAYNQILSILNKDQRGKLKPSDFNIFAYQSINKLYAGLFTKFRLVVSRQNRFYNGQGLAKETHFVQQHLEHYLQTGEWTEIHDGKCKTAPDTNHVVEVVNPKGMFLEKVDSGYFNIITSHRYQNQCNPYYRLEGNTLYVSPGIEKIKIQYLRKPKKPNWTYKVVQGTPIFNPDAADFCDLDIHPALYSSLVEEIAFLSGVSIREPEVVQVMNQQKNTEIQKETLL